MTSEVKCVKKKIGIKILTEYNPKSVQNSRKKIC